MCISEDSPDPSFPLPPVKGLAHETKQLPTLPGGFKSYGVVGFLPL